MENVQLIWKPGNNEYEVVCYESWHIGGGKAKRRIFYYTEKLGDSEVIMRNEILPDKTSIVHPLEPLMGDRKECLEKFAREMAVESAKFNKRELEELTR